MRIAIVEDDKNECLQLMEAVGSWINARSLVGSIQAFSSAEDFISAWVPNTFSLVLMDCILSSDEEAPTGLDVVRDIRKKGDDTPVVFVTCSPDFAIEGYTVHAAGYLLKPVSGTALNEVLDSIALPEVLVRIGKCRAGGPRQIRRVRQGSGPLRRVAHNQGNPKGPGHIQGSRSSAFQPWELRRHGSWQRCKPGFCAGHGGLGPGHG